MSQGRRAKGGVAGLNVVSPERRPKKTGAHYVQSRPPPPIPCGPCPLNLGALVNRSEAQSESTSTRSKILLVDDEPSLGYSFRRILENSDSETILATNVREGLELFHSRNPDV